MATNYEKYFGTPEKAVETVWGDGELHYEIERRFANYSASKGVYAGTDYLSVMVEFLNEETEWLQEECE